MKTFGKFMEDLCPPIIFIIGIIILWPPRPEPVCPACGFLINLLINKFSAILLIVISGYAIVYKIRNSKQNIKLKD